MSIIDEDLEIFDNKDKSNSIVNELHEHFVIEKALNDCNTMKLMKNGRSAYVHSTFFPKEVAHLFVDNFLETNHLTSSNIIVLFGIGLGYELNYLIEKIEEKYKEKKHEIKILVFEPEKSIFDNYIKNNPINFEREDFVEFIVADQILNKNLYYFKVLFQYENIKILKLHAYFDVYKEEYLELLNIMKDLVIMGRLERNTRLLYAEEWNEKEVSSLKHFFETPNAAFLKELLADKPAVIVAAGPSLNKNIQLLKEAKNKFFIVCVYTAYRPLQKAGIEPDLVVSIDTKQKLYDEHINGIDVPIIFGTVSSDEFINKNKHKYNNIMSVQSEYVGNYFPEEYYSKLLINNNNGGTVASVALDILVHSGANPIIFVGQDLGYPDDGTTHVEGSFYDKNLDIKNEVSREFFENARNSYQRERFYVKGNYSEKFSTDEMMYSFLKWYEIYIAAIKEIKDMTFINATEGGAYIEGTEVMTFKEVLEKYETEEGISENFKANLKNNLLFETYEEKNKMYNHIVSLYKEFCKIATITEKAENASNELRDLFKYTNFPQQSKVNKLVKILDEADVKLRESTSKLEILEKEYYKISYFLNNYEFDESLSQKQLATEKDVFLHAQLNTSVTKIKGYLKKLIDELNETYEFDAIK